VAVNPFSKLKRSLETRQKFQSHVLWMSEAACVKSLEASYLMIIKDEGIRLANSVLLSLVRQVTNMKLFRGIVNGLILSSFFWVALFQMLK